MTTDKLLALRFGYHKMTTDKLLAITLNLLPDATISEDSDGQIVINTGLEESDNGTLQAFGSWTEEQITETFGDVLPKQGLALYLQNLREEKQNCDVKRYDLIAALKTASVIVERLDGTDYLRDGEAQEIHDAISKGGE